MNDYLKKLDSQMRTQGRNTILLVDNAPAHSLYETINLTNIKIEFLPPNTTAHDLQPCIINNFKAQYRKLLLRNRVKAFDNIIMNMALNPARLTLKTEMVPVEEILKAVLPDDNQENEIEALDFNPLDLYHQLLIVKQLSFITK
ncbi:unnamed protein product [Rhizophagus irregularis]|nr:unnamed protein product [Rhizophagus irregularis]